MNDYVYGNTRLRARRTRLLGTDAYAELLAAESLQHMMGILSDSPYGPDVEAAIPRAHGLRRVDQALRTNLARMLRDMVSFYEGQARTNVELLVDRWDRHNLTALVRLPDVPLDDDPELLLVPAGRLNEADLAELVAQPDVTSRIDLVIAWGIPSPSTAHALLRARRDFDVSGDSLALEWAVEEAFAARLDEVLGESRDGPAAILRGHVDRGSLLTALRRRAARLANEPGWADAPVRYLRGGALPIRLWEAIEVTDEAEAIVTMLGGRRLIRGWDVALVRWGEHADLPTLGAELRAATAAAAVAGFSTGDPLGFDIPVAYAFAKEVEVRNLRLISRAIVHGISAAEVESRLEPAA